MLSITKHLASLDEKKKAGKKLNTSEYFAPG